MKIASQRYSQSGFTLLEAMLTLFILTIGILGVAGLQVRSMDSGRIASQRMMVVIKGQEIIERMRANVGYGDSDYYKGNSTTPRNNLLFYAGAVGNNQNCNDGTTVCAPNEQAAHDIYMWAADLAVAVPTVTATNIAVTAAADQDLPYTVTITINWTDKNTAQLTDGAANTYNNLSYTASLQI